MKYIWLFVLSIVGLTLFSQDQLDIWQGQVELDNRQLDIKINLRDLNGHLSGQMEIVGQGKISLDSVTLNGKIFRFKILKLDVAYEGIRIQETRIEGTLNQRGQAAPLNLIYLKKTEPSPAATPHALTIDKLRLEKLSARVQSMVDREEIVGGELLIVHQKKTLLRQAYGWKDRESNTSMDVDDIYCVRSMTKPLTGTLIQMLVEEGRITYETPVHSFIPSFSKPGLENITIEHLLTHSAGFPFTTITKTLHEYGSLKAVADEAAERGTLFEPGTGFQYSDAGSDTLGAIIEVVTGEPIHRVIEKRILDPLNMKDSITLLEEQSAAVLSRIPSAYSGGTGSWSKHWQVSDPAIYPFFLTSQSLYATTSDYARFLQCWMDRGSIGDDRILQETSVQNALTPAYPLTQAPSPFAGIQTYYGQQWIVYQADSKSPFAFGHDGSDGTFAWAWPEHDLMILFFTQSRGTLAGFDLGHLVQQTLFESPEEKKDNLAQTVAPITPDEAAGLYWDETNRHAYYVVIPAGERIILERPGRMRLHFKPSKLANRFNHEARNDTYIEFERDVSGKITAMRTCFAGRIELNPIHQIDTQLPSVQAIVDGVKNGHHAELIADIGPIRITGTVNFKTRKMQGTFTQLLDAQKQRTDIHIGGMNEVVVATAGEAWTYATGSGTQSLSGERLEAAVSDRFVVLFGDWTKYYEQVRVLKNDVLDNRACTMVRVVPKTGSGSTFYVDAENGQVVRADSIVQIPGLGQVGVITNYKDYRDVKGVQLPFRAESQFATPLIGLVEMDVDQIEPSFEINDRIFELGHGTKHVSN